MSVPVDIRRPLVSFMLQYARTQPEHTAVVGTDRAVTYGELWDFIAGYARYLTGQGFKPGDKAVVQPSPTAAYVVTFFAIHLSRGVFVPVEKDLPDALIGEIAENVGAKWVIVNREFHLNGAVSLPFDIFGSAAPFIQSELDEPLWPLPEEIGRAHV